MIKKQLHRIIELFLDKDTVKNAVSTTASSEEELKTLFSKQLFKERPKGISSISPSPRSHTKKIEFRVQIKDGVSPLQFAYFDVQINKFFLSITNGHTLRGGEFEKIALYCESMNNFAKKKNLIEELKSAIQAVTNVMPTDGEIVKVLFYSYNVLFDPSGASLPVPLVPINQFDMDFSSCKFYTWPFYPGLSKKHKELFGRGTLNTEYIKEALLEEAKKHPIFDILLQNKHQHSAEILSLLKLCSRYNQHQVENDEIYSGIVIVPPLTVFFSEFKADVIKDFFTPNRKLRLYSLHSLVLTLGMLAKAVTDDNTFSLDCVSEKEKEKILADIKEGKIKWVTKISSNKWRFNSEMSRFFFMAFADYLQYKDKDKLVECIINQTVTSHTTSHLDKNYTPLLCYSHFLLSFLREGNTELIGEILNELLKYANNYAVEARDQQISTILLFSVLLAEKFPIEDINEKEIGSLAKKMLNHSFGRGAYPYQMVVLKNFESSAPKYFKYLQEKVLESLELDNGFAKLDPYFILVASKLNMKESLEKLKNDSDKESIKNKAIDFFQECIEIHKQTWPLKKDISKQNISTAIIENLESLRSILYNCEKENITPEPGLVYGGNLLLFSLANLLREDMFTRINDLNKNDAAFNSIFYIDYFTRKLSKGYNTDNTFFLMCGPFRVLCAAEFGSAGASLTNQMLTDYKSWFEKEYKLSEESSKRYLILLTRMLSYTNFFGQNGVPMPTLDDCRGTATLPYDNLPDFNDDEQITEFLNKPRTLFKS